MNESRKVYKKRDFIYNNGLVNAFIYLGSDDNSEFIDDNTIEWSGIKVELKDESLVFYAAEENIILVYKYLIGRYYEEIMETTDNKRLYVTEDLNDVVEFPKISRKSFAGRVKIDKLQDIYGVKEIDGGKFIELSERYQEKVESGELSKGKFWHGEQKKTLRELIDEAKDGKKHKVDIYLPISKIKNALSDYIVNVRQTNNKCIVCGSSYTLLETTKGEKEITVNSQNMIYDFGSSPPVNRDHRLNYKQPLCFMCDLFYKMGMLNNYFYNATVFMFDSYSLRVLKEIKRKLGINNEYIPVEKGKTKTNMSGKLGIYVDNNSHSSQILGTIYFIYEKIKDREDLIWKIGNSVLVKLDVASTSIEDSIFYNRLSDIFRLFRELEQTNLCCGAGSFIEEFMRYHYNSVKNQKEYRQIYEDLSYHILNFMPIEHDIFEASYVNFVKEKSGNMKSYKSLIMRGYKSLRNFLEIYKKIRGDEKMRYKEILNMCYALGDRIGYYAAEVDEKNIVYQIREIGNLEKLVEFFRDFEYSVMKNNRGDILNKTDDTTGKKYSQLVEEILKLADDRKNISLIRDLLGIFAVQKYLSTKYAKGKSENGGN